MLNTKSSLKLNKSIKSDIKEGTKTETKSEIKAKSETKTEIKAKSETKSEIKFENNQPYVINNNVNITPSSTLIVEHIGSEFKFIIKNSNNMIGFFTVGQVFKYINQDIENYLIDIDLTISAEIIQKYLYKIDSNDDSNLGYTLISHLESPITGNIDILVKLYSDIVACESKIQLEYTHLNDLTKKLVMKRNRKLVYNILSHIIKLFAIQTSTNVQNDTTRDLILKYTIGAQYKLSTMIQEDIDANIAIIDDYNNICLLRKNINLRMEKFNTYITAQSEKIDCLLSQLESINLQTGGRKEKLESNLSANASKSNLSANASKSNLSANASKSNLSANTSESFSLETSITNGNTTTTTNTTTLSTLIDSSIITGGSLSSNVLSSFVPKNKSKSKSKSKKKITRKLSSTSENSENSENS